MNVKYLICVNYKDFKLIKLWLNMGSFVIRLIR